MLLIVIYIITKNKSKYINILDISVLHMEKIIFNSAIIMLLVIFNFLFFYNYDIFQIANAGCKLTTLGNCVDDVQEAAERSEFGKVGGDLLEKTTGMRSAAELKNAIDVNWKNAMQTGGQALALLDPTQALKECGGAVFSSVSIGSSPEDMAVQGVKNCVKETTEYYGKKGTEFYHTNILEPAKEKLPKLSWRDVERSDLGKISGDVSKSLTNARSWHDIEQGKPGQMGGDFLESVGLPRSMGEAREELLRWWDSIYSKVECSVQPIEFTKSIDNMKSIAQDSQSNMKNYVCIVPKDSATSLLDSVEKIKSWVP